MDELRQPHEPPEEALYRGEDVVVLTARLPVELADALFHEAVARGATPSDLITTALRALLEERQR